MTANNLPLRNPYLKDFWQRGYNQYGYIHVKVLYGGRSSSKSWDAAAEAIRLAMTAKVSFWVLRNFESDIKYSFYNLLKNTIARYRIAHHFVITLDEIICLKTGSSFIFDGLALNLMQKKGKEGINVAIIEEAELLTEEQFAVIQGTLLRYPYWQMWVIFNPRFATDYVYQNFILSTPKDCLTQKINYTDNPYLDAESIRTIELIRERDINYYRHYYLGEPRDSDDDSLLSTDWIESCVDAHIKLGIRIFDKPVLCGIDLADEGNDNNAIAHRQYILLTDLIEWSGKKSDLFATAQRAFEFCDSHKTTQLIYDGDGIGGALRGDARVLNEQRAKKITLTAFKGNAKVAMPTSKCREFPHLTNEQRFANLKAQAWFNLRYRIKLTHDVLRGVHIEKYKTHDLISFDSKLPLLNKLKKELAQIKIETKTNTDKLIINKAPEGFKSPNLADAVMMVFGNITQKIEYSEFKSERW